MANLGQTFDSDQYGELEGFDPIPADKYTVAITGSSVELTKKGDGKYIALEHTVLEGTYKGRKIWSNLNIQNPNPQTVEIAQKTLATLCRAIGKRVIADTVELHDIPCIAKVKVIPAKGDYPAKNGIVTYQSLQGEVASPSSSNENSPVDSYAGDYEEPDDVPWE